MKYRSLGQSGLKVSMVSLGSWLTFGNTVGQDATDRVVHAAFERGVNLFDTADVYNQGEGERALGKAIADLPRHHLVIASKCYFPMSEDVNDRGLSRKHVCESIDMSLRRLDTDYLDLYQCHRPDADTPLGETAMAMDDLVRRGKTLYWGVSYWPAEMIAEVVTLCRHDGLHAPISNQPPYNLFERTIEESVIPTGDRLGVGQIVFSPLAQGVLTGKYRSSRDAPADGRAADARINQFIGRYLTEDRLAQVRGLVEVAGRMDCSPAQLALAWCLRLPNVTSVIVGARNEEQMLDNLQAVEVVLPAEVRQELDDLFPA